MLDDYQNLAPIGKYTIVAKLQSNTLWQLVLVDLMISGRGTT